MAKAAPSSPEISCVSAARPLVAVVGADGFVGGGLADALQARRVEQETGETIDAIIFVAGTAVFGKTNLIPQARARETFEPNFWACAAAAQSAAQHWEERNQAAKFVAVLSIVARRAVPFEAYHAASKAATARFLESLQLEYAGKEIEFMCIFPGLLRTPLRRQRSDMAWS